VSLPERMRQAARTVVSPVWLLDLRLDSLTRSILAKAVKRDSHWLDVGCGLRPFESSFAHARYTGIDVKVSGRAENLKRPDKFFDGEKIPYEDRLFDGILCTQVLEHAENLDMLLPECNRVLKDNGYFVVSMPFVYREHEQPHDFRRFTTFGLRNVLERNGFEMESSFKCLSGLETIATLFSVYLNNNIGGHSKFAIVAIGGLITTPVLLLARLLSKVLPDNGDLYCSLVVNTVKRR
jgi:SAM-dependent methyltransferase